MYGFTTADVGSLRSNALLKICLANLFRKESKLGKDMKEEFKH